ncbi:MAG: hypothetical protein ACOVNY_12620 [Chitinophagaceae bacterium]
MKTKVLIVLLISIIALSCNKEEYTTKPQLELIKVSSTSVVQNQNLRFEIEFRDKEGDVIDTMYIQTISKLSNCPAQDKPVSNFRYRIPTFNATKNQKGVFEINFLVGTDFQGCRNKNDTLTFKFCLKDKQNNLSDTLTSPAIAVAR